MRLFLDTNVIVDYFGRRQPFYADWERLNTMQIMGDAELWVSAGSFTDTFYLLRREVESSCLQRAFVESFDFLNICSIGESELRDAAKKSWLDYEDCLVSVCAERAGADYIISRDKNGFQSAKIPVFSPADFFRMLEEEYDIAYGVVDL